LAGVIDNSVKNSGCSNMDLSQNQLVNVMLEFVRAAVLDRNPIISKDITIDWDVLMDKSSAHGLLAWVWDGICRLPSELQPPRQQRINWGLSAQEVQERYFLHKEKVLQMVDMCKANGMKLLLLKGIGLSRYYPKPSLRQSRDIDIYLFGDCERGNELLFNGDVELHGKHYVYCKNGLQIENHIQMFSNVSPLHKKVEDYLETAIGDSYLAEDGYYMLSQESLVVYLLMHSLIHLCHQVDPIRIQNIVDFGMVLKKYDNDLLPHLYNLLESFNLNKAFLLFVNLSEWALDIDLSRFKQGLPKTSDDYHSAVNLIIDDKIRHPSFSNLPKYRKLFQRWFYYKHVRWRYKYIPSFGSNRIRMYIKDLSSDVIRLLLGKE
jgi:hypothetical protein